MWKNVQGVSFSGSLKSIHRIPFFFLGKDGNQPVCIFFIIMSFCSWEFHTYIQWDMITVIHSLPTSPIPNFMSFVHNPLGPWCLHVHGCGAIHWNMGKLVVRTTSKGIGSPPHPPANSSWWRGTQYIIGQSARIKDWVLCPKWDNLY